LGTLTISTSDVNLKNRLNDFNKNGIIKVDFKYICIVSNLLAEYVVNNIDDGVITGFIKKNIKADSIYDFKKYFYTNVKNYLNRKLRVYDIILSYLKTCNYVNFDGFIKFRLKEYYKLLENIIYEIKEEYISKKEYEEFIYLIKTLIDSQTSIVSNLNILADKNGKYQVFDDYFNNITEICLNEFIEEFDFSSINKEDFIFSTIISLSPETITFHKYARVDNNELIKTIFNIYGDKVIFCEKCSFCEKYD